MIFTLIALGSLIFIHESSHFLASIAAGIPVEEFSVGFGKVLFQKELNGTKYSLRLFLIGGYVRLSDSFRDQSPRIRIFVALAGPAANLLFALLAFTLVCSAGLPELTSKIGTIYPGHPAATAGFLPGDRVLAVEGRPVAKWMEMTDLVNQGKDRSLLLTVQRGQRNLNILVRPEIQEGRGVIGVKASGESVTKRFGGLDSITEGGRLVVQNLESAGSLLLRLVTLQKADVAGPLKILKIGQEQSEFGISSFLNFCAILSVSFFIFNLIPLPALDGGIILLALFEALSGRQVNIEYENKLTKIGISIILSLMMFVLLSDAATIFQIGKPPSSLQNNYLQKKP